MKGPISLAQELRAIRSGGSSKVSRAVPEPEEAARPWQADIDRMQQALQDVLQAVSQLSGVELRGVDANPDGGQAESQLDRGTLKDQIRNDLEAFSSATTANIIKQAEEQVRATLGAVQEDVSGQIDHVTREFQAEMQGRLDLEQLQVDFAQQSKDRVAELIQVRTDEFARWVWLTCKGTGAPIPSQIEKLLEPYAEEALAKFTGGFQQRVQQLFGEHEQMVQGRLQSTTRSLESQVSALEQSSLQIFERNADTVAKQLAERLRATAEEDARSFQRRSEEEIDAAVRRFRAHLEDVAAGSQKAWQDQQEQQAESFRRRIEALEGEIEESRASEIAGRIEQTAAYVIESSVQQLHQQAGGVLEHSKEDLKDYLELQMEEVRVQADDLGRSVHETLARDAARADESLKGLDQELAAVANKRLVASEQQLSALIQGTMESLTGRIRQIAETQMEEIKTSVQESQKKATSQYESQLRETSEGHYRNLLERIRIDAGQAGLKMAEEVRTISESVRQELSEKANASISMLREEAIRATSRIESSIENSHDTYQRQLAQINDAGLAQQRNTISKSVSDLQQRLRLAAQFLSGEGVENFKGIHSDVAATSHDEGGEPPGE